MKKGRFLFVLATLLVMVFSITLVGCTNNAVECTGFEIIGPSEFTVGDFALSNYKLKLNYSNDTTGEVALTGDMISEVDKTLFQEVGKHSITITYNGKTSTFSINVIAKDFTDVKFENETIAYDGNYHSLVVENLPENSVVTFDSDNEFKEVGSYTVTATITNPQYTTITKTATLTITKAIYDMNGVVFEDSTVEYDGEAHYIYATNLPSGVTVEYVNNGQTEIGEYEITAKFIGDEYHEPISDMTAQLTIIKSSYDMSNVVFNDEQIYYDGEAHYIYATNLPSGVTVEYVNNGQTEVGEYEITAKFTGDEYHEPISDMTAVLNIYAVDLSGVKFEDKIVEYDGNLHKLEIIGELPKGIFVKYENNEHTDIGVYDAIAKFVDKNGNSVGKEQTAKLSIVREQLNVILENKTVEYDGSSQKLEIKGQLPEGIKVVYVNNDGHINADSYKITAKFVDDLDNDLGYPDKEAILTITKRKSKVNFAGNTDLIYNGEIQKTISATLTRILPTDKVNVILTYSGEMIEAGEYKVTATIDNLNYELENSTTTVNITRANHNVTFKQEEYEDIVVVVKDLASLDISTVQNPQAVEGYDVEWNIDGIDFTCITKDIVIKTTKTPIKYTITYDLKGGINNPKNPTEYTIESDDIILYAPTKVESEFNGWYKKKVVSEENKISYIPAGSTGDITIYADWLKYIVESVSEGFEIVTEPELCIITTVPNAVDKIDLNNKITISDGCHWELYRDFEGNDALTLKAMSLDIGMNKAYIIVKHPAGSTYFTRYKLQIYRLDVKSYSFMANGEVYNSGTIEELSTVEAPKVNPERTAYTFGGWSVNGEKVEFPYLIINNTTFNAIWNPIPYDIKYNLNGGSLTGENTTYTVEDLVVFAEPTREHYTFAGWYDNAELSGKAVTGLSIGNYGDKEYFAKWIPVEYAITLDSNGGVFENSNVINYNIETETFDLQINVTKKGYTFVGWYESLESVEKIEKITKGTTGDKTLYAKWHANDYIITYDVNMGDALEVNKQKVTYDTDTTLIVPTKTGYTFNGWYIDGYVVENGVWKIDHDVTLIANWQANTYTITTEVQSIEINYDSNFKLSDPELRQGYTFDGWYDGEGGTGNKYTDKEGNSVQIWNKTINTTLYPKWIAHTYEIKFNANNGSGEMPNQQFTYDIKQKLQKNEFVKVGYSFKGWTLASDGNGELYTDEQEVTNLSSENNDIVNLYAKWQAEKYGVTLQGIQQSVRITFNLSGASGIAPETQIVTTDNRLRYPEIPTRSGYVFAGWYDNSSCIGMPFDFSSNIGCDKTLYAKWISYDGVGIIKYNSSAKIYCYSNVSSTKEYYAFVPLVTGEINIYSDTSKDTCGYLYDINKKLLKSDRCSGYNRNFKITYNVAAGTLYYVRACRCNGYSEGQADIYVKGLTVKDGGKNLERYKQLQYDSPFKLCIPESREGYTFIGWYDGEGGTGTKYTDEDGYSIGKWDKLHDAILYQKWIANSYTVKYNANGGLGSMSNQEFTYDKTQKLMNNGFTRTGYTFDGWTFNQDGTVKILKNEELVSNLTSIDNKIVNLYAKWKANSYRITYDLNTGDSIETNTQIVEYNSSVVLVVPAKTGYTFNGWYNNDLLVKDGTWRITQDVTLVAKWQANNYGVTLQGIPQSVKITFNLNGASGIAPETQNVTKDKGLKYPKIPKRSGYVFAGWYDDSSCMGTPFDFSLNIECNKTLYAKWVSHNGEGSIEYNNHVGRYVYCYPKDDSPKEYFAFIPLVTGEITIYSESDLDTYGYLYDSHKRQLISDDQSGNKGNFKITYNVTAGNLYYVRACGFNSHFKGPAHIYVKGPIVKDGGKYIKGYAQVQYDSAFKLEIPKTKEGYTFDGWYDGEGGTGTKYTDRDGNSIRNWDKPNDAILYQKWYVNKYNITFESNGGSIVDCIVQEYGSNLELPIPTWAEKSFEGWYDSTYTIKYTSTSTMPASDLKLYAKWVNYEVKLTILNSTQVSVNDDLTDPAIFGASAIDTDGNNIKVTVELLSGNQVAGQSIMVRFIAQGKYGINDVKTVNNIKVYGMPNLTYDTNKDYINITDTLNYELFNAQAVDTYSQALEVIVSVKEDSYKKGDIITIVLSTIDISGNNIVVEIPNIKVYGEPNIVRDETITNISTSDVINNELFGVSATDSFGEPLEVTTNLYSGSLVAGAAVTIESKATDSKGNIKTIYYDIYIYGTPNISDATLKEFKVGEEITLNALGVVATDSFGDSIDNIILELTNGTQEAGGTLTYTITATDKLGNIASKVIDNIKIYGVPSIIYNTEKLTMLDTDNVVPELIGATATDSFGKTLTVNISIETGVIQSGKIVTFKLSTEDKLGNTYSLITNEIKVYSLDGITLEYNKFASVIIKADSKGEEFLATATDSFGAPCTISIKAAEGFTLQAGNTIDLIIVATDVLGNTKESEIISGIKVYGTPVITYARDNNLIYDNENPYSVFLVKDSFGSELVFNINIIEGTFEIGKYITYEILATDRAGNSIKQQYRLYVVGKDGSIIKLISEDKEIGYKYIEKGQTYKLSTFNGYEVVWSIEGVAITDNQANSLKAWDMESNEYVAIAQLTIIEYDIQYNLNGGSAANPEKFTITTENITVTNPTKDGYNFIGWTGTGLQSLTENLVIDTSILSNRNYVANWEVCVYTITYDVNKGDNLDSNTQKVTYDEYVTLKVPTRAGYTFIGWYKEDKLYQDGIWNTSSDITLVATWEANLNILHFNANSGIGVMQDMSIHTDELKKLTINTFTKEGYKFVGWSTTNNGIVEYVDNDSYTMGSKSEETLYAVWEIITYDITYVLNDGVLTEKPLKYTVEDTIDLSLLTPTKEYYDFVEWQKAGQKVETIVNSTGDITLTAIFTLTKYTINYILSYGENNIKNPPTYTIEDEVVLSKPTKPGCNFVKWQIDGIDTNTIEKGSYGEKTATAIWETIVYNIKYHIQVAENIREFVRNDNIDQFSFDMHVMPYDLKDLRISKENYVSNGWFLDPNYSNRITRLEEFQNYDLYTKIELIGNDEQFEYQKYFDPIYNQYLGIKGYHGNEQYINVPSNHYMPENNKEYVVRYIYSEAFTNLNIRGVFIPNSIEWIEFGSFKGCNDVTLYWANDDPNNKASNPAQPTGNNWNKDYSNGRPVVFNYGGDYGETKDGFRWALLQDGTIAISEYVGQALDIVIPRMIEGRNVTTICENAFKNNKLNSIIILSNIKNIYGWAFMNTQATLYFEVERPQTTWSKYWNAEVLKDKVVYGVSIIDSLVYQCQGNEAHLIKANEANGDIVIPQYIDYNNRAYRVIDIGIKAFAECKSLRSIVLPEGLLGIKESAFYGCSNLINVSIPSTIEVIDLCAFAYCSSIKNIIIPEDEHYLFRRIPDYAFQGCSSLENISIPRYIEEIGPYAFIDCVKLRSIIIPRNVNIVGRYAFENCNSLTIYCESDRSMIEGPYNHYDANWNHSKCPVVYNYEDINDHTYTLSLSGGPQYNPITAKGLVKLPVPLKEGLYFDGWYNNPDYTGESVSLDYWNQQNVTLYGRWLTEEQMNDGSTMKRAKNIGLNTPETIKTTTPNQSRFFKFIPEVTQNYKIKKNSFFQIYLYDENGTFIQNINNDKYTLEAHKTYYIEIHLSNPGEGTIEILPY